MTKIHFGKIVEEVITRDEFPLAEARSVLGNAPIAVLGYGSQGRAQALNLRDNGFQVMVGQRTAGASWNQAVQDGWTPEHNLFGLEDAASRADILLYLLSDAGQKLFWPRLLPFLTAGKTLAFAHGFSIVYRDLTGVVPPRDVDVVLAAPKGSGLSLRRNFLKGSGLNFAYAVGQDASGMASKRCRALAMGAGALHLFPTSFEKEVYCNLTSERGVLLGALAGLMEAQYAELRSHGHHPSEAYQETVETLTESLLPLVSEQGMEWMYAHCSATAQRGALDWKGRFREAVAPLFRELYQKVESGEEAKIVLEKNSHPSYRAELEAELKAMSDSELWQTGKALRALRPQSGSAASETEQI